MSESAPLRAGRMRLPLMQQRRWLFFGLVAATTLTGIGMMLEIVRDHGITVLEILILALFAVTFGWIAVAFWNAVVGFGLTVLRRHPLSLRAAVGLGSVASALTIRTALVMPVHNEDPARVMGGLAAMLRSLSRTGQADRFDVFLLSDTTDPRIARAEEAAWASLREDIECPRRLYYRRRAENTGRKAGNIADFCQRWGSHYEYMVVLDADSVMTGPTMVELVRAMEANPAVGLIQTVPMPARRTALFGRLVQFAACLHSPMIAAGQSFWQADSANYWGHNAIIRVGAFTDHCRLPVLPGHPPLGGAILSHDFVEAALMRRAGWQVCLLPWVGGSYEEVPGNIVDFAARDRRWSQGSLQHLRLLTAHGLLAMSRLHFVMGALGYVSSLLWFLMLLASTAYVVFPSLSANAWTIAWRLPTQAIPLLTVTFILLFVPKLLALSVALGRHRHQFGGATRLVVSAVLEMVFAVLIAPVMMLYHTRFVLSVLSGHDVKWEPQVREGRAVRWREAWRATSVTTVVGVCWAGLTLYHSPAFFIWLAPIFTGLVLAAPLVWGSSSLALGRLTRDLGLFLVATEAAPPLELQGSPWRVQDEPIAALVPGAGALQAVPPELPYVMPAQLLGRRSEQAGTGAMGLVPERQDHDESTTAL